MINEKFYDEIKEELIENISDTLTLNLAISLLEDSKKYKVDSEYYKQALNEIKNIFLCYGETFDSAIHQEMQSKILEIIDEALGDEKC